MPCEDWYDLIYQDHGASCVTYAEREPRSSKWHRKPAEWRSMAIRRTARVRPRRALFLRAPQHHAAGASLSLRKLSPNPRAAMALEATAEELTLLVADNSTGYFGVCLRPGLRPSPTRRG